jgi:hypothetical protein
MPRPAAMPCFAHQLRQAWTGYASSFRPPPSNLERADAGRQPSGTGGTHPVGPETQVCQRAQNPSTYSEIVWLEASWTASTRANANRTTGLPNSYRT